MPRGRWRKGPLFLVAAALMLVGVSTTLALLGDVNNDSVVDDTDAHQVLETVIGMMALTPEQAADADVDGDGDVDVADAQLIQQFADGVITSFPPRLPQQSSPITLTRDGLLLGVVNPDSDTVTFLDTVSDTVLAEVAVGREPTGVAFSRDGGRALVTNARDASVAVIDTQTLTVVNTIPVGVEPFGVVVNFRGDRAYVSNMASATVSVVDLATETVVGEAAVGFQPQGLAVSGDSATIYVTHLKGGEVSAIDAETLAVTSIPLAETPFDELTPTQPAGVPNRMKGIAIHPTRAEAWLPHILSNSGNFVETLFNTSIFPAISRLDTDTNTELAGERLTLFAGLTTVISNPEAVAFTPDGSRALVVAAASNDLVALDATTGQEVGLLRDVGDNPRGIVVHPGGGKAYVFNRLTPEVSIVKLPELTLLGSVPVSTDPLPPNIANGRRLFFTSALSEVAQDRFFGCEGCHFDGRDDGQTWFFTNGPRQTLSMAGGTTANGTTGLLHHNGDRANVQDFRFTFTRLQNGTGLSEDQLNDLADFVDLSIRFFANPFLNPDLSRTAAARRGRRVFQQAGCAACHSGPFRTDAAGHADLSAPLLHDVGTFADGTGSQDENDKTRDQPGVAGNTVRPAGSFESTFLLGVWATSPFLHDGRAATLLEVLTTANPGDSHGVTSTLTPQELDDLVAYMQQLDITNARVRIAFPADGARVVQLTEVRGQVLADVAGVEVFINGAGPIAATVENGQFTAVVPPELVPAVAPGTRFDITALATTVEGEPGRDDVEVEANFGAAADPATSTVTAQPTLITADGEATALITVTPRDGASDPVGTGLQVAVQTTLGTLGPVTDVGDGTYVATLTAGTVAGIATVSAQEGGGGLFADTAEVRFAAGDVDAAASSVSVAPGILEADGISTAVVTVVPRDAFGNPLGGGQTVAVAVDLGTVGTVVDQGNGSYTAVYTAATVVDTATISAMANSVALTQTPQVTLVLDTTAPPQADLDRLTFATPAAGVSQVAGGAGSVEPLATVHLTNTDTGAMTEVTAAADGGFAVAVAVTANEEICVRVDDLAGNMSPEVCTVPFPVDVLAVRGVVQTAQSGGGFAPVAGALVELDIADLTDPCNPGFNPVFAGGMFLTATTEADGSFAILLPEGFVPDPDLAVVTGPDGNGDGVADSIDASALVNDTERTVLVDEISTTLPFLICFNDQLLGVGTPFPESNFTPAERAAIDDTLRAATTEVDFFGVDPLQEIANDVFFDADGPKDAADTAAFETFESAAESPGDSEPPVIVQGTVSIPSSSGDVPLDGVTVELATLSFKNPPQCNFPFCVSPIAGASGVTDASGHYGLTLPGFVVPGSTTVLIVDGDLAYNGAGQPGAFNALTGDLSLGAFVTDPQAATDVDLAGRAAISLITIPGVPIGNFNPLELEQLLALVRTKIAGMSLTLANQDLRGVFTQVFDALTSDQEVLDLVNDIADPEGNDCNLSADVTSLEADGASRVTLTIEPLNQSAERVGPGRLVTVETTLGTVTSPAIDLRDGLYRAFLQAPTVAGEAQVTAALEGADCPTPLSITFNADVTAPQAPNAGRILFTGLGATTVTVVGLPGAVEPGSRVSLDNTTQGTTVTVTATPTGSFRADIGASAGHQLSVHSTDAAGNAGPSTPLTVADAVVLPAIANPDAVPDGATASVTPLAAGDLGAAVPAGFTFLRGFELTLDGAPAAQAGLEVLVESGVPVPAGANILLVQAIGVAAATELRVVAPGRGAGGLLFPLTGPVFPGVIEPGRYAYLAADQPQAFLQGTVTGDRGPIQDALVTADASPFADLSRTDGTYLLAGPVGAQTMVGAALFVDLAATTTAAVRLPFAEAEVPCSIGITTRAERSFSFTGRFAGVGQTTERLAVLPSGQQLYVALNVAGDIAILDTATLTQVSFTEDVQRLQSLAFTPNGFEAFIGYLGLVRDFTVDIEEPGLLLTGVGFPRAVTITQDGNLALVASSLDNSSADTNADAVFAIDTFTNVKQSPSMPVDADPAALAVNAAGSRAYVVSLTQGTVTVLDLPGRSTLATVAVGSQLLDVAVSMDGSEVYVADLATNSVLVLDAAALEDGVASNEILATIAVGRGPRALALTPDATRLLVAEQLDGTVSVIDLATRTVTMVWATVGLPPDLVVHPAGTRAYILDNRTRLGVLEVPLAAADTTAPHVVDVGARDRAGPLLQDSPVEIVFSERMATATLNAANIQVLDATDAPISGGLAIAGQGVAVVFTPTAGVRYDLNSTVKVVLGTGLTDAAGNALPSEVQRSVPTIAMQLPDLLRIAADLTVSGVEVTGEAGAVHPGSRVEVTNQTTGRVFAATAGLDGSFSMVVEGLDTDGFMLVTSLFGGRARTAPVPVQVNFSIVIPDPGLVSYQPGPAGTLQAVGAPGAVDPQSSQIAIRNLTSGQTFTTTEVGGDGSFAMGIFAAQGDVLDLVSTILGVITLAPVPLASPAFTPPVIDFVTPDRFTFGEAVTLTVVGTDFGEVPDNILLRVGGAVRSDFILDTVEGSATQQAILVGLPIGADSGEVSLTVRGQTSNTVAYFAELPANTSPFAEEVISSSVAGDPSGALGANDANFVDLGAGGDITLRLGSTVLDGAGNDLQVFEDTADGEDCYEVLVSASPTGPFDSLGQFCGTAFVNLAGHDPIRFVKLVDAADGGNAARIGGVFAIRVQLSIGIAIDGEPVGASTSSGGGISAAVSVSSPGSDKKICLGDTASFSTTVTPPPQGGGGYGGGCTDTVTWSVSGPGSVSPTSGTSTTFTSGAMGGQSTITVQVTRSGSGCSDAGSDSKSVKVDVIEVEKLEPNEGEEADDMDGMDKTKAFVVKKENSGMVTVTATPKPAVPEADLPACWMLTGGTGSGKLARTVAKNTAGETAITAKAGMSEKITKIIVAAAEFARGAESAAENRYGYDEIDPADKNDDHVSVKKSDSTKVKVKLEGGIDRKYLKFVSSDESVVKVVDPGSGAAPEFLLTLEGQSKDKNETTVKIRAAKDTGPELANIHVNVYKSKDIAKWTVYRITDSTSAGTSPLSALTAAGLKTYANDIVKQPVMEFVDVDVQDKDIPYDKNGNGALDWYYDGGAQTEFSEISGAGLTGDPKIAVVKTVNFAFRLSNAAAASQNKIKLMGVSFLSGWTSFSFKLGTGANQETVNISSISGTEVTLTSNLAHAHAAGEELIAEFGSGASADPQIVEDNHTMTVALHETLHRANVGALKDLTVFANIMYYAAGGGAGKELRFKGQPKKYEAGNENQWQTVPR